MGMSKQKVIIRKAVEEDKEQLLELIQALADFEKLPGPDEQAKKRLIEDVFGLSPKCEVVMAFIDKKAVGYAVFFLTYFPFLGKSTLYLENMFVLDEYRGEKIGHKLFMHCVNEAKKRNCGKMEWLVLDWNTHARYFYEKHGAYHVKECLLYCLPEEKINKLIQEQKNNHKWKGF